MISSHNTDYSIIFYNDRVKEIVDAAEIAEPFTYIPPLAGQLETAGENVIVVGDITEGNDIVDTRIEAEITYSDIGSDIPVVNLEALPVETLVNYGSSPTGPCLSYREIWATIALVIPTRIYAGSSYVVNVIRIATGETFSASYTAGIGDVLADVKTGLVNALTIAGVEVVAGSPDNQIYICQGTATYCDDPYEAGDSSFIFNIWSVQFYVAPYGFTSKINALKCGATHGFGIVYKDNAGRQCSVVKGNIGNIYLKFYTEDSGPGVTQKVNLSFKISHKPPAWATTYEIVYFGNLSMDYYYQMRIDEIINLTGYGLSNHYAANIQETIDYTREKNTRWKVPDYTWEKGDRIRLLGYIDVGDGSLTKYDSLYDYEIEETGTAYGEAIGGEYLYFQAESTPASFAGETNIVAEIYRPRKGLAITTPYGCGMVFSIGTDDYGNKYHKGDTDQIFNADGTLNTPASVSNTAHDGYKFQRLNYDHASSIIHPFWCEDIFSSDWWEWVASLKLTSNGFPFLDDLSQRQTILRERIRHGGSIIAGTRTNNIAHFTYDKYKDLPRKHGIITGLRVIGYTLSVIQEYKETSYYINRIQTFNPDGTEQFTLTDSFLGTSRPKDSDYGCQHPWSVLSNGRNIYYWDNSHGALIRSAPNGQVSLSGPEYKMSRYFKDIARWIQTLGGKNNLSVNIGSNNDFDEIWITFQISSEIRGLIFSEKDGRFKSRINLTTEGFVHLGVFFAHIYRQRLWIMNVDEGQSFLSWSGVDTHAEIEIASNLNSGKNKTYDACAILADHELTSESKSVVIPEEASACNEIMETNIPIFERKEGIFYGKIMKDENSKGNFATTISKKLNGRSMRGRYCFLKFVTEEHDEKVRINSIVVFSTDSERNI